MFKLLVLSALFAAVVAKPDVLLADPLAHASYAIGAPLASTYVQSSSYLASPAVYSDLAYTHLIKKRAVPLLNTYVAPSTYVSPWATSYVAPAPITYASSVLPAYSPAHFIKKRSAQLLDIAPSLPFVASAPLASTYSSTIIPGASVYSAYPGYAAAWPFFKK